MKSIQEYITQCEQIKREIGEEDYFIFLDKEEDEGRISSEDSFNIRNAIANKEISEPKKAFDKNTFLKSSVMKKPLFIEDEIELSGSLDDLPEREFIVERLAIEKGYLYLFCAGSGSGKTMFLQYLACCVQSGKPLFGQYPVAQGDVYHLDQEQGKVQTTRRYNRIAAWMGLTPGQKVKRVSITSALDNVENLSTIEDDLVEQFKGKTLVIVDSLKAISESDENSAQISEILRAFKKAAERANTTIIMIHHMGKVGTTPRGHSSIKDSADGVIDLELNKDTKTCTISFDKVRDGEEPLGLNYTLHDEGERNIKQKCSEKIAFELLISNVKPKQVDRMKLILQALNDSNDKLTNIALYKIVKGAKDAFNNTLKLAEAKKYILIEKDGDKNLHSITEEGKTHLAWISSSEDCK